MTQKIKTFLKYIVPPVITVGLCIILYSNVNWGELRLGLLSCDFRLVVAFLGFNVLAMVFRALRWRLQLRAIDLNPGMGPMLGSIFGCYAVNLVFPRLGEFWRTSYMAGVCGAPFSMVFGSMVADRLADTLAVLLITATAALAASGAMADFASHSDFGAKLQALVHSPWPVLVALLCVAALFWLYRSHGRAAMAVKRFVRRMWAGFAAIFTMPHRPLWLLLTLGIWGAYYLSMYLSMLAYPPSAAVTLQAGPLCVLVTFVFGSLAMAVPSNGGIGPWQFAIILALSGIYGLSHTDALTFATINLGATTLLTILLGIGTFIYIGFSKKFAK